MNQALVIYREERDVGPYEQALLLAGVRVVLARPDAVPPRDGFGGLVLTGGTDVDPALYGEARVPESDEPDRERDRAELNVLGQALQRDLPVLAICRGLQLMNVFHGGSLVQHLAMAERHRRRTENRALPAHTVSIEPGTLLGSIAGIREWPVNSRHHQGIKELGKGLIVSAKDSFDGLIEAVERPDKSFVLGVQWHPENQAPVDAGQLRIFERFGTALQGQPEPSRLLQGKQ